MILEGIWPSSERPEAMRDPDWVEDQSIGDLMQLQKAYAKKEQKETGQSIGKASRDVRPSSVQVEAGDDDCDKKLHPGRFLRPPISRPKHWYGQMVPIKYNHIYRNIPMKHIVGLDTVVAPQVIIARHDRTKAFSSNTATEEIRLLVLDQ